MRMRYMNSVSITIYYRILHKTFYIQLYCLYTLMFAIWCIHVWISVSVSTPAYYFYISIEVKERPDRLEESCICLSCHCLTQYNEVQSRNKLWDY